jgi:hypothetical protein
VRRVGQERQPIFSRRNLSKDRCTVRVHGRSTAEGAGTRRRRRRKGGSVDFSTPARWWDVRPYSIRNAATAARPPGLLSRSVTPRIIAREAHAGHRPAGRAEVGGVSRSTLAGKIDAILKLSVVASVLLASSSVGYYYLVHLPHQDAQFEPERVLERFRGAAKKRAEQELLLFEQQAWEQRAAEQQAAEERQALEKANRYQVCLSRATDNYNASRLAACIPARKSSKTGTIVLSWASPKRYARWHTSSAKLRQIVRCQGLSHFPWTPT